MELSIVDSKIPDNLTQSAKQRFQQLACELGVREDNCLVGSGMGGNTLQLCVLNGWKHQLDTVPNKIDIQNDTIVWDPDFLAHVNMRIIRKKLNRTFPRIVAKSRSWIPDREFLFASEICGTLARDLDAGNTSYIAEAGKKLTGYPLDIVLVAIRTQLRVERIVKYNLDDHPVWSSLLAKVSKTVAGN